ncbi:SH3 domain-containing protein [Zoogloea sp.]|uniref:SH3 domain-containing protein n=1 Tax=Zoogloea sp. TaxID=49181 RepID=UPI0025E94888|nr:SH3 domain-containing protein [Zoogloea sp.]MCK6394562.1 hypothetical protein [Zoogloea sp.]
MTMSSEIGCVSFNVQSGDDGSYILSVGAVAEDCPAVEFIAETLDGSWASQVTATRAGSKVVLPPSTVHSRVRVRLFNDIGKELYKDSNPAILIKGEGGKILPSQTGKEKSHYWNAASAVLIGVVGYFIFQQLSHEYSAKPLEASATATTQDLAILSRKANLRRTPALLKDNVLSTLPFGTQLVGLSQAGDFLEVRVVDGQNGYIHKDVAGDAARVRELGSGDSLGLAQTIADDRRDAILRVARELQFSLFASTLYSEIHSNSFDPPLRAAIIETSSDDVSARFFHYLAEEATSRRNLREASVYYRAAAISNPKSVADVHGWGITQLRMTGAVDESTAFHALVVAPRSTNTWLMLAAYLSSRTADGNDTEVVSALRLAATFSTDRQVTKRFFADTGRSTSNKRLQSALVEVMASMP